MKTSTMIWTIIVVLVVLGLGWYFFSSNQNPSITTPPAEQGAATQSDTAAGTSTDMGAAPATQTGTQADSSAAQGSAPMNVTVTYDGRSFSPQTVTVAKGGTVTFSDTAGRMWLASDPHPIHNLYDGTTRAQHCAPGYTGPAPFDECQAGTSFSFTFDKTGSFGYHDHLNDAAQGTVVVQ